MKSKFFKVFFSLCLTFGMAAAGSQGFHGAGKAVPHTDGYWTDGYWDGATQTWHDGYWTETSPNYSYTAPAEVDTCGWVVDWNNPAGGYCSYYQQPAQPAYQETGRVQVGGYSANIMWGIDQWIVDMPGTAAMFDWNGRTVVADHASQGFKVIRWANTANVNGRVYHLASRYYGNWAGGSIYLSDGREFSQCYDGELIMYTCTGSGATVTYWN